jgi:mycofactocin precursor
MTAVAPESVATQSAPRVEEPAAPVAEEELILADLLVEEISIDGMCGVY